MNEGILYYRRDTMRPKWWRLGFSTPGSSCFTWAEGECSAIYYPTAKAAVEGGKQRFGRVAVKADW